MVESIFVFAMDFLFSFMSFNASVGLETGTFKLKSAVFEMHPMTVRCSPCFKK